jgi:hypothetical protein
VNSEALFDSDANRRIRQLYSLLQPHAAAAQALLERLDRDNPFGALARETEAPDEFVSLARRFAELPVGEVAALLDAAIAADKGDEDALDLERMRDVLARLNEQVQSVGEGTREFAEARVPLPAPLPADLQKALKTEEARLERDLAAVRARMIKEHDLRILRNANVPPDTIAAIVRDAPKQEDIDQLTGQLEDLRRLLAVSADAAGLAERLQRLESLASAARELLGPILDPIVMQELRDFAQPIFESDDQRPREA